ncbi:MAG: dTDP-4-dehydrorhamnose 3,5-epimerase [Candidatus Hydrogenedentes bacterium]|nr:dTDP-4-dehydrorhamnose 3,5-epimerase [Candidatus Hydrogenedentota bacterium]
MPITVRETALKDVLRVETGIFRDERGFFTEAYSQQAFEDQGIVAPFVQDSLSESARGTVRGLHYQIEPHGMGKLVRVLAGSVYDVAVDLRRGSPTFGQWLGEVLSAENRHALWIPSGFAHGFLALEDQTLVLYKCTTFHTPDAERAIHYQDPTLAVTWPFKPSLVSKKDAAAPNLDRAEHNFTYYHPHGV